MASITCTAAEEAGDGKEDFFSLVIFERGKAEELRALRGRQWGIEMQVSGDVSVIAHAATLSKKKSRNYSKAEVAHLVSSIEEKEVNITSIEQFKLRISRKKVLAVVDRGASNTIS